MAGTDRKTRYIVEYVANLGPLKRLAELQEKFNRLITTGSSAVRSFASTVKTSYDSISSSISRLTTIASRVGQAFGSMKTNIRNALVTTRFEVAALGTVVAGVLGRVMAGGVKAAADAQEVMNRFNVSFAEVIGSARQVASQMQKDLRLGQITVANYLASTQDLLVGFGVTQKAALGLSDGIVRLSLDLASWNNIPFDVAMRNMLSGLVGNHEALRSMRVVLTQATLERKAEALGIQKSWKQLDEATKVYLRYQVALEQSKNALGDLQRTQHETTNRFRFFSEQVKSMYVNIFPKFTDWLGVIAEKFGVFLMNNAQSFKDLGDYLEIVGSWLDKASTAVINFLSKWKDLRPITQQLLIFVGTVSSISAPILGLIVIFGRALTVTSMWVLIFAAVALALQDIYAVMRGGNGYFKQFLDYFGWTTDSVRSFISGLKDWAVETFTSIKASEGLKAAWDSIWGLFKQTWDILKNDVWPVIQMVWGFFKDNAGIFAPAFNTLVALVKGVLSAFGIVWAVLTGNTERITHHFDVLRSAVIDFFVSGFSAFGQWIKGAASLLFTLAPNILQGLMSVIMNVVSNGLRLVINVIVGVFGVIFKSIGFIVSTLFNALKTVATTIKNIFVSVFESVVTFVLDSILTIISKIRGIQNFLPNWVQKRLGLSGEEGSTPAGGTLPPSPEIPEIGGDTNSTTINNVTTPKVPRGGISVGEINIPIVLPENFSGNPDEIRRLVAEEAQAVVGSIFNVAYDDNSGVV